MCNPNIDYWNFTQQNYMLTKKGIAISTLISKKNPLHSKMNCPNIII
jgi:hypothetical protein